MSRLIIACLLFCGAVASAQPVTLLSASSLTRARDADIPGGLDGDFSSLSGTPASDILAAAVGLSFSQATIDMTGDSMIELVITVDQAFDNSGGGTTDVDSASFSTTVSFTASESASYVIAGNFDATGADGYSMAMQIELIDLDDFSCCLNDMSASTQLDGAASFEAGVIGDGNAVDEVNGSLTGILTVGHRYSFQVSILITNDDQAAETSMVAPNFSSATATGQVTLTIGTAADPDSDGDGVPDSADNCTLIANASQLDTNGDGIGNVCDADINGDCNVNFGDLALLKAGFFPVNNPDADFTGEGLVNFGDLAFMKSTFFNAAMPGPGPSGVPNACD